MNRGRNRHHLRKQEANDAIARVGNEATRRSAAAVNHRANELVQVGIWGEQQLTQPERDDEVKAFVPGLSKFE
jgi:predicted membrane chloride channel (bestrophin family)